jgi:D-alanyl-D-alanine carboxypeptidase
VLGADTKKNRTQDSIKLIEYCFSNFEVINLKEIVMNEFADWKEKNNDKFEVVKGLDTLELDLSSYPSEAFPINKNYLNSIDVNINCNYVFTAPVAENTKVGILTISFGDSTVLNFDIVNTIHIDKKNFFTYFYDFICNYENYLCKGIDNLL